MKNVLGYLDDATKQHRDKVAVIYEDKQKSYKEFNDECQKIGSNISQYTKPRDAVIVLMDKSEKTLSACIGCIYAGTYYVNITSEQPKHRILEIMNVTQAKVMVVETYDDVEGLEVLDTIQVIEYAQLMTGDTNYETLNTIRSQSMDTDPLYCNFTSGSTGKPKGVVVSHRSVIDFMNYFPELFDFSVNDVFANQAPLNFDVSIKDIFTSFKVGGTLLLIPKKYFSVVTQLLDYLEDNKASVLIWAVSALCMIPQFRGFRYKVPDTITKVLFSGEVMPINHLRTWRDTYPNAEFVNLYGPTEITCNCAYFKVPKEFSYESVLPIGKAFPNESLIVLDDTNKLITEKNKKGELYVAGSCLALGYLNNDEMTQKAFVQNPLHSNYPETVYKTGDLVYFDEDDNLVFAGRADFQIKHMGFRIELEDIEQALQKIDAVSRAMCHYDEEKSKISAYIISTEDTAYVKQELVKRVPTYMVPSVFYHVDSFPLTNNGKINRKVVVETFKEENNERNV